MNNKMKWLGIFVLAASLLLTACGAPASDPTPTATPEPTATAEPTATPETTAAAEPTEEPTAEPVSQPVDGIIIHIMQGPQEAAILYM